MTDLYTVDVDGKVQEDLNTPCLQYNHGVIIIEMNVSYG